MEALQQRILLIETRRKVMLSKDFVLALYKILAVEGA